MANCAMMNVPRDVAEELSLYDYEELLWNWNEAHRDPESVDPPEPEETMARLARINANPKLTGPRPKKAA